MYIQDPIRAGSESKVESGGLISLDQLRLENGRDENVILVLGSEGEGISRNIARNSDYRVIIPP